MWELYDLRSDFNERVDLAKKYPGKLEELRRQFDEDARRSHISPMIDWEDVFKGRIHRGEGR